MNKTAINITINGTIQTVAHICYSALLTDLNYLQKWSAVEINGEIIPRDELSTRYPQEQDCLEIITPVGGGSGQQR